MSSDNETSAASSPATDTPLNVARNGRVLILTLNRPERLNALTPELHLRLHAAITAAADDAEIGAVVLTGAGRAFCSGGDMGGSRSATEPKPTLEQRADELLRHSETARLLHEMPKPTLAMINGPTAGAGLALALACDLRFASDQAIFSTSYVKVALSGDLGVSYFLTQLVGSAKARELMLLGDKIDAPEALRIGLIQRAVDAAALRATTLQIAQDLANGPAVAFRYIKQNLLCAETRSLSEVIDSEAFGMARCGRTQDIKEAVQAFRDKRAPIFKGC